MSGDDQVNIRHLLKENAELREKIAKMDAERDELLGRMEVAMTDNARLAEVRDVLTKRLRAQTDEPRREGA